MLSRAATLELSQIGNRVNVRVINETGHKLPSGYPEGRRMWIHVETYDDGLTLLAEHGRYETLSAELTAGDTKVYEAVLGIDAAVAAMTGRPQGKGFHFALNNVILKDNRIPPRGFTNAAFREIQAAPVGVNYADGQYWDDTRYRLPVGASSVTVALYYQTASKDYITFLRDENRTDLTGQTLYDQWELTGKSSPVRMATGMLPIEPFATGDADEDTDVDGADYGIFALDCRSSPGEAHGGPTACQQLDFDGDGDVDLLDYGDFQLSYDPSVP
jgi:hypothetical protein